MEGGAGCINTGASCNSRIEHAGEGVKTRELKQQQQRRRLKTRAGDDFILSSRARHTTEGVGSIISELSIHVDIKEILVANDDLHFLGGEEDLFSLRWPVM